LVVWAFTTSIKAYLAKLVKEQTAQLELKLDGINNIAHDNKINNQQIKNKVVSLNHDFEKLEKKTEILVNKMSLIKCIGSRCENTN
jgi:hypothetical protein